MAEKQKIEFDDTKVVTWFERDRAHVDLQDAETDETIIEWWDEDVFSAIEDGFLDSRNLHRTAYDYADSLGVLPEVEYEDDDENDNEDEDD